jgi:hypothetical protein
MRHASLKRLALLMAVNCVRNTVIEDYHAAGKLDDAEMKAFNQEVANKLYTFLHYLHNKPIDESQAFLLSMGVMYPKSWDQPKIDRDLTAGVRFFRERGNDSNSQNQN